MKVQEIETARLRLRKLRMSDFDALRPILQDIEVMYAWEHAFSDEEVRDWLAENLRRYQADGYSYLAAEDRENGNLLGTTGLLTEQVDGTARLGIGWIYGKRFWGKGFAQEGAAALLRCAFETMGAENVIAAIRPENQSSRRLAERLGMTPKGSFLRPYRGKLLEHLIYETNQTHWKGA